jgi:hypothetical protein
LEPAVWGAHFWEKGKPPLAICRELIHFLFLNFGLTILKMHASGAGFHSGYFFNKKGGSLRITQDYLA